MKNLCIAFNTSLQQKRQSAEVQYDNRVEAPVIDYKNLPMIKYLRERAEKKMAEKKLLRRSLVSAAGVSLGGKGGRL